jgi:hypothetical protein
MANVKLSAAELSLVTDASFILTKNSILAKVQQMFGLLSEHYQQQLMRVALPEEVMAISPKISRGENYEGMPWLMLDYPRCFGKEHVLAIRTFFWWGHFFSITLQVKGSYRNLVSTEKLMALGTEDWYLCVSEDEWQHHFKADNYQPLSSFNEDKIKALSFIKLAKKIPLKEWDDIQSFLESGFEEMVEVVW